MIKILFWNCRGIANTPTQMMLHHLITSHKPDLIFLTEPKTILSSSITINFHSLGFTSSFSNQTNSLWCLFNPNQNFSFSLLAHSNQHITIEFADFHSSSLGLVTGVYRSTDNRIRRDLWDHLSKFSNTSLPWCVIGDFNSILLASEKLSIKPSPSPSVKDFNDMVLSSGLKDLGFRGNSFTWANNRQGQAYVAARLDRAFTNSTWLDRFGDLMITHLPRLSSDHSPLILSHRIRSIPKNMPFKFEEMWLSHNSFKSLVEQSWSIPVSGNPLFILAKKLKILKGNLKVWNLETFGQLKRNVEDAEKDVLQAQLAYDSHPSAQLLLDLNLVNSALYNWLNAESTHWKQKAKLRWLQDGDRNTRFFHQTAKSRSILNRIDKITVDGTIFEEEEDIRNQACLYYS
eukprot:TRINITY_DN33662_c0_g2_i1.p1 TRINITY_DN33662_c0_g2~~TRINITY_DN33662_c0_g2_i1.p1  ORF type:complete len:402 (-),score=60.83 TRINITY_DN33662_c0_g2_i1:2739-3944(-)